MYHRRIYNYNRDFFKVWSPELAYFAGLFAADGNLRRDTRPNQGNYYMRIESQKIDKHILYDLHKILGLKSKVHECSREGNGILNFGSYEVRDWLVSIGIDEYKTSSLSEVKVPDEFMKDFLRGFIDGDGCYTGPGGKFKRIIICGTKSFLLWVSDWIKNEFDMDERTIHNYVNTDKVAMIQYGGKDARILRDWLYKDATLFIKRKRKKAYNV